MGNTPLPRFRKAPSAIVLSAVAVAAALTASVAAAQSPAPAVAPDAAGYEKTVAPFLAANCNKCHTGARPKGEFRTDPAGLPNDFSDLTARGKWKEVVNVLNAHEMPPKKEKQPAPAEVAAVVDWIVGQTVRAETAKRDRTVVLRRLNRSEYRNTIRDLVGVDFDPETFGFPNDPPAGGFDNNGGALGMSPLQLEMYLNAARTVVDRALVDGDRPAPVKWRFEPKVGDADRVRKRLDPKNNPIVNGGNNRQEGEWVVVHRNGWDKHVGARDFRVPAPGIYAVRVNAAGRVPTREEVVASAERILKKRQDDETARNPKGAKWHAEAYERDLAHFRADRMYDYGAPRAKLVVQLGPQPRTVAEFDVDAAPDKPKVYEHRVRFTTESAGVSFEYAYGIPSVLENFWLQGSDQFARPDLMISWFEIEGPLYDAWPPSSHTGILFDSPTRASDERGYVREVLSRFMRRAYRRPVGAEEVDAKLRLYDAARKEKPLVEAVKMPLMAVLASPHFLFLAEPAGPGDASARALNDHELASRLSYFLWSTMPDEALSKLAEAGKLRDPATLTAQVDRMLADPKADALVKNFAGQWLSLRDVGANPPAPDLYPQYDRHLETSIVGESESFFREVLAGDLDARNFIKSDFVVINERLARFYGIPGVKGDAFRKVPVPAGVRRGGVVTQASVLTITSNGTRTSPVKRGTWVLKNLLGIDPGLPVANAGEIAPKVPGIDKATVRKRLEIHRQLDQCARCHNKIDPLGFALENYNASGEWREQEGFGYKGRIERNDPKIDASSMMPDGTEISGVEGLQKAMLAKEDLFLECLAGKMLTYALGRELGLADQPTVKAAVAEMKRGQYTLRSLIKAVVGSEPFRTK
jgi:mono/diheme cytochrome c family protein